MFYIYYQTLCDICILSAPLMPTKGLKLRDGKAWYRWFQLEDAYYETFGEKMYR